MSKYPQSKWQVRDFVLGETVIVLDPTGNAQRHARGVLLAGDIGKISKIDYHDTCFYVTLDRSGETCYMLAKRFDKIAGNFRIKDFVTYQGKKVEVVGLRSNECIIACLGRELRVPVEELTLMGREKSNMSFQINDRVIGIREFEGNSHTIGLIGTVVKVGASECEGYDYAVEFDKNFKEAHHMNGIIKRKRGRYFYEGYLDYANDRFRINDMVLANDGKEHKAIVSGIANNGVYLDINRWYCPNERVKLIGRKALI